MKNPFRSIRWRKLAHRLAKGLVRVCVVVVGIVLLAAIGLDLYCEVQGLPVWAVDMIKGELAHRGIRSEFREVRVGILSAVTVEDATFTADRQGVDVVLRADRVKARLGLRALFSRQPFVKTLDISGATFSMESRGRKALLPHFVDVRAELRVSPGDAYTFSFRGLSEGVSIRASGRIQNAKVLWQKHPPRKEQDDRWIAWLETATRTLRECRFGNGDATIEATVDADAADWASYAVMGHVNVTNIMLQGVLAQTFKGQFTASRKQVVFRDLLVRLNREEHLFGKVVLEPKNRRVWAELEGQCTPVTAFHLANKAEPEWLQRFDFTAPLAFKAVLHPSPLDDLRKWHVEATCQASGFALRDLPVKHFAAQFVLEDQVIRIPSFNWDIATERTGERATGKAKIWPEEGQFSLEMTAVLDWQRRCRQLDIHLPPALGKLNTGTSPPQVRLVLRKSPYDWKQWQGTASVRTEEIAFAGKGGGDLRADLHFGGNTVRVEDLRLDVGSPGTTVTGRFDVQLPEEGRQYVQLNYDLAANDRGGTEPVELAAFAGAAQWFPETERIAVRGEGTTRLVRTFDSLGPALGLPDHEQLQRLRCAGKPLHVRFTLPDCPTNFRTWRVNADVKGEDVLYSSLRVKDVESKISIAKGQVILTDLHGTTAGGETFKLNMALAFSPFSLHVSDGELRGDPMLIQTFIGGRRPQETFRRIWEGFTWDAAHPPIFRVPSLLYRQEPRAGDWRLVMEGTGEFEGAILNKVLAKRLTLSAKLDLPGSVTVSDVVFTTDEAVVKGDVQVSLDGVPSCDFRIAAEDGGCDPRVVIRMIRPNLEEYLDSMKFAADSRVTCTGSFFLAKDPRLNLAGTVQTSSWQWGKAKLADVTAKWGVRESEVRWDISKATCCGGQLRSTGVYDAVTRVGDLAIEAEGASLNTAIAEFGLGEPRAEQQATLAASGRVRFFPDWAGRPLQLTGAGQIHIAEGDLWRVPILSQLGKLLDLPLIHRLSRGGTAGLGNITALRADLLFDGERVSIPSLVTDGTVVSLSGSGEYSWRTDRMEFDVVGETFRRISLVSFVTKPLSWVFNARLSGTRKDYKWRLNNALKRAIIGEGTTEKRRLKEP